MVGFIFCHGWGFTQDFWRPLLPYFQDHPYICWDLGYFGPSSCSMPDLTAHPNWVGVGHSLGMIKLLEHAHLFKALIGLQGFTNFLGSHRTVSKVRKKELAALKHAFYRSPEATLKEFYQRCGISSEEISLKHVQHDVLYRDLESLSLDYYSILPHYPMLIMGSENDPIVPPTLIEDNFSSQKNVSLAMHSHGHHALGWHETPFVSHTIKNFLNERRLLKTYGNT